MMKTAILISGELRTFSICRPTMTFLDDPNADIYVSTWDRSIVKNKRINLNKVDLITEESISAVLNRPATIMVEPLSCIEEKKYNSKMIHRWLAGIQMILDSGQDYDYVLVTRPDLFFNHTHPCMFTLDSLIADGDKQFAWYEEGHKLQDNLFFAKFETMKELFSRLTIKEWQVSQEGDWHTWWTKFVGWADIKRLGGHVPFTFCRPIVKEGMSFIEVYDCYIDWRDMQIVAQIEIGNRAAVVKDWGEAVVTAAETKSFEHYKVIKPKVAVLISGEYRTFDSESAGFRRILSDLNCDIFMSTWAMSVISNPVLGVEIEEQITYDKISANDFINYVGIHDTIESSRYCENMVELWHRGLAHINTVGKYDYVLVIRPDLCVEEHLTGKQFSALLMNSLIGNDIVFAWSDNLHDKMLGDICFFGTHSACDKLMHDLPSRWIQSEEHNWHKFLFNETKKFTIASLPLHAVINRHIFTPNNFQLKVAESTIWSETKKTIKPKLKTAVLVCGMIRQLDVTVKSWAKLKQIEADWYLSTWDKSCQSYSTELYPTILPKTFLKLFDKINVDEYDDNKKFQSYMSRCGSNSLRYLHLLSVHKNVLAEYDRIIIIRPDTFVYIPHIERFVDECVNDTGVYSNVVKSNFIQDFLLVVSSSFFSSLDDLLTTAHNDRAMNPHIKLPEFLRKFGQKIKQAKTFDATLARPNSRDKLNSNIKSVHDDFLQWNGWHTS